MMAKRSMPSGDNHPNPYQQFGAEMRRGRSSLLLEEAHPELQRLVEALRDIDDSAGTDKAALIDELRTTGHLRGELLADLLERYELVKRKGKGAPRRPAYVMTDIDLSLAKGNAAIDMLLLGDDPLTLGQALDYVAWDMGVFTASQLGDFRTGRRRSVRKR
jgi:hypothetical protein